MKIVISTDIYYPMINGVAVFSRNLAAGLTKRGHDVLVLAPSISGDFESEYDEEYGFKVVRLSSKKMMLYPDQINKVPEKKDFASFLQSRISDVFSVDIHPAAKIGKGLMLDHATNIVIGETAVIADTVSMLHDVHQ